MSIQIQWFSARGVRISIFFPFSSCFLHLQRRIESCSGTVIETIPDNAAKEILSVDHEGPLCAFCEMIVFWIQVQLKQKKAKEKIFQYVDEVISLLIKVKNTHSIVVLYID